MESTSDLCRTAAGDHAAFARLVKARQGTLFGFLGRMGLDAQTCEDIAQETFLRVWRHAASFDPKRGSANTWILTIARNQALNHLARRTRSLETNDDEAAAMVACATPRPDAVLEDKQSCARLHSALARLAPPERTLLAASYVEDLDLAAIAAIEGCSRVAAKVRLHRARAKLKKILEEQHD